MTIPRSAAGSVDPASTGYVDEDILVAERDAAAFLQHGKQQAHAVVVGAEHGPARSAERGRRDQRLQLEQEGPRSLQARHDDRTRRVLGSLGEKKARRGS